MSHDADSGWIKRRPINYVKPPKSWIRDCDRKGCSSRGSLHAHAPRTHAEATILARLAIETANSDPWTAATRLFGGQS